MVNVKSPVIKLLNTDLNEKIIKKSLEVLKIYELYPANQLNKEVFSKLCAYLPDICKLGDNLFGDEDPELLNTE